MKTVEVALGDASYPIHIGAGIMAREELLRPAIAGSEVLIVTNETIAPLYAEKLRSTLAFVNRVEVLELPDGEKFKTLATFEQIVSKLLSAGFKRSATLIALGGGVVGDTTGFAAACYQRGVGFIQMPTTLLAQVDSSVGGKTAVNHPLGKNMIGAFYQPGVVIIDTDTLVTLPAAELTAGLAEVIKHGVICDAGYLERIDQTLTRCLARDTDALTLAIAGSCQIKAEVVAQDEKESGVRALLNFGHTFGHAIETAMGYGEWLHGEAVGAGMVMAADLSWRLGMLDRQDGLHLRAMIERAGLPVAPPQGVDFPGLMARDKKATDTGIRFVLLEGLGKATLRDDVPADALNQTLSAGENLLDWR